MGDATEKETVVMGHINALLRIAGEQRAEYLPTLQGIQKRVQEQERLLHEEKQRKREQRELADRRLDPDALDTQFKNRNGYNWDYCLVFPVFDEDAKPTRFQLDWSVKKIVKLVVQEDCEYDQLNRNFELLLRR